MKLPATPSMLRVSGRRLRESARAVGGGDATLLLRFYSVECLMKARYLSTASNAANADTDAIPKEAFGSSGHDLDAGRKALRMPAQIPPAPKLREVSGHPQPVEVMHAHQVWRYGIDHERSDAMEVWFDQVTTWLEESK